MDASIAPGKVMSLLSPSEVANLLSAGQTQLHALFRRCALAVLNSGSLEDDVKSILETYADFSIEVIPQSRGIKLAVHNAPANAFVDGHLLTGIREHLFSVLRDIIYIHNTLYQSPQFDFSTSEGITNSIFHILRHADLLKTGLNAPLVICWGGHSISRLEYDYTKKIGYELGLRNMNIGTGCGPGAMKGPMKGATIGHAKQHIRDGRYIGLTEPDIIAAEPPNPIVNELVILPDIEKRLEAFVRTAHGIIVFPGGAGTAEEILYLMGILLHEKNRGVPFPVIFTAPYESRDYFTKIDEFLFQTLGPEVRKRYEIIIGNPPEVAKRMKRGSEEVFCYRRDHQDAYYFNWLLHIPPELQKPFDPTHEAMAQLRITHTQTPFERATALRKVFSGVVAGNVKATGIARIEQHGPYQIHGDMQYMHMLDELLRSFIQQGRMKLGGAEYHPCFEVVKN
jgi:hypothetical protein